VAGSVSLSRAVSVEWLRRLSALAFRALPPRRDPEVLLPDRPLRRKPDSRLYWAILAPDLMYTGNGYVGCTPSSLATMEAIGLIDAEGCFTLRRLFERLGGAIREADLRAIVEDLYAMRVIDDA
jgi:hypothetical protein